MALGMEGEGDKKCIKLNWKEIMQVVLSVTHHKLRSLNGPINLILCTWDSHNINSDKIRYVSD